MTRAFLVAVLLAGAAAAHAAPALLATCSGHSNEILRVAFAGPGRLLSASDDKTIRAWDPADCKALGVWRGHRGGIDGLAVSPDGKRAVSAADDHTVRVWDVASGKALKTFEGHPGLAAAAFFPDGARAATAGEDGTLRIWDLGKGQAASWTSPAGLRAVAVAPDGKTLYSAGFDGTLRAWDAASGSSRALGAPRKGILMAVAVSPDGARVLSAGDAREIGVWDVLRATEAAPWSGHRVRVLALAFSPDGARAASADDSGEVRLWEAATGKTTAAWQAHASSVIALAFSPDGKRLATAGWDTRVRVWDLTREGGAVAEDEAGDLRAALERLKGHGVRRNAGVRADLAERGRKLFFDPALSANGSLSCASCHRPDRAYSNGEARAQALSGPTRRRVPSLLTLPYSGVFFWDGRAASVEDAVRDALKAEMGRDARTLHDGDVAALAAFALSLAPPEDSPFDRFRAGKGGLSPEARRGFLLFEGKARCARCHIGPDFTDSSFHRIGLAPGAAADRGRFEIERRPELDGAFRQPSLRNVSLRAPYMHDGRFKTLREVVDFYDRGGDTEADFDIAPLALNDSEKAALVAFLESLTAPARH